VTSSPPFETPPVATPRVRAAMTFSRGLLKIASLPAMLGVDRIVLVSERHEGFEETCVVTWGDKPMAAQARRYAQNRGIPFLFLEDGFLRSVELGVRGADPLSIIVDDIGIYYDATRPSRLERMLTSDEGFEATELDAADRLIDAIVRGRVSKYNVSRERDLGPLAEGCDRRVLVVDQTAGDRSVVLGNVAPGGFRAMLDAALSENPTAEIVVNVHPDVASGRKKGIAEALSQPRVRMLRKPVHPASLLDQVDHVYAMTSLFGFEALLRGKKVTCFGVPFYSGWGLTDDRVACPRRNRQRSLREIVAAAYLRYARYVDPETGSSTDAFRVVEHLALQRRYAERDDVEFVGVGFSPWKQTFLPRFLGAPANPVSFRFGLGRSLGGPAKRPVVWGVKADAAIDRLGGDETVKPLRMEDGFLRSVGLGSDSHVPASLVVDATGIYFDGRRPSDLESILENARFEADELARAAALRKRIVALNVSKYNVGRITGLRLPERAAGKRVVLVVGQVEDDASIRLGCIDVRKNADLLAAARLARPDAFIVWKPHPDVTSGNRRGDVPPAIANQHANLVVTDVALGACLAAVNEVHTMTSLVGFEALLRHLDVVVYGLPFYAGWGLTTDRHVCVRRTRRLALDELVAGTLIRYPRYVHPNTREFTTPEAIVEHLVRARASARPESPFDHLFAVRFGRKIRDVVREVRARLG